MTISIDWLKQKLSETGHHPMGASGASTWMNCAGSVAAQKDLVDKSNPYAEEGSKAHDLAEQALVSNKSVAEVATDHSPEMITYIQSYVDYVKSFGGKLFVEQRIKLSHIIPECEGTADAIVYADGVLHVIDLKYGMGLVSEHSPQLKIYLSGVRKALIKAKYNIDKMIVHIFQPRNGGARSTEVTHEELDKFEKTVKIAADLCLTDNAPLNPSEKACQWCKAKPTCPALYEHNLAVVGDDFEQLPTKLTDAQIRKVLEYKPLIESWLKGIEHEVFSRLERGDKFEGFKMVEGRSQRKWAQDAEEKLLPVLGDDLYEQKLKGIIEIEKALVKKQFSELNVVIKPPGKPTLVPESDKREAISIIAEDFSKI